MLRSVSAAVSAAVLLVSLAGVPRAAHSQGATPAPVASAYVPLDDNAYVYADALIARGRLRSLSRLERPYRVNDIKRAMATDAAGSPAIQALYQRLAESLVRYDVSDLAPGGDVLRVAVTPYLVATAQTSGQRELMLADSISRFRPGFGGVGIVQAGPLVVGARAYDDPRLKDDPEFLGQKNRAFVGRMEDAYLSAQFRYAEIFLGRLGRNWGPPQLDGLLLGHSAYTYDHAYLSLGVPALRLSTVLTRLDDNLRSTGTALDTARRYFSVHQLALRLGNFEAAVSEAVVYGGRTEGIRFNYANPVTPYILAQVLEKAPANTLFGLDASYRSRFGNISAQGMIDDITKDRCPGTCAKPNSFAFTLATDGVPLGGVARDTRLFASYTLVSSLAYRNEEWYDSYMSQNVGLGRGFSDYDEARLGLDVIALPGVPLRPYIAYRRQGEGDYRTPHPAVADYPTTRQFLIGVVQHTTRYGISGVGSVTRFGRITADAGVNQVHNAQHVHGASTTTFEGRLQVTIDSPWRLAKAFRLE